MPVAVSVLLGEGAEMLMEGSLDRRVVLVVLGDAVLLLSVLSFNWRMEKMEEERPRGRRW